MNYFVTGATGFIGRYVVERLLARRNATVYVLVRKESKEKFEELCESLDADRTRLNPVWGDITQAGLCSPAERKKLIGNIDHVFHLAAVYDMNMNNATGDSVNNQGTRNLVEFTNSLATKEKTPTLQHTSSIAVAGAQYVGTFTEKMFDEGQELGHPYLRTKYESERIVREESRVPWRVYRPGMVIGDSMTGHMDKVDGPYYFFPFIKRIRDNVPKWFPLLGIEGGKIAVAPVDYVADAMVEIAHQKGHDGKAFHLVQRPTMTVGKLLEILFDAAHGPGFARKFQLPHLPQLVPAGARAASNTLGMDQAMAQMSKAIGIPISTIGYINNQAHFDDRQARAALKRAGIQCPQLKDYAEKIWEYWEDHLDYPGRDPKIARKVAGKVILITGASSGIGLDATKKLAANGATVVMVARTESKLKAMADTIRRNGGDVCYYPCDLNDLEDVDRMAAEVLRDLGHVDVLVNNAGRSIRRAVWESLDRFHDFERTMQLNYFSCVRLIMALLPAMAKQKEGHIINISSIGVLGNASRFAAYLASKSALDAFSRSLASEVKSWNIDITTIYMPLVRTPLIRPTKMYDYVPAWSPDAAGDLVVEAVLKRPKRMKTPLGQMGELSYALWPRLNDYILSKSYHLFPTSAAAMGRKSRDERPSKTGIALAQLLRGAHI